MYRLLPLAALAGCMSLDGMVYPGVKIDAYNFDFDEVPSDQVMEVSFDTEDGTTLAGVWVLRDGVDAPSNPLIFFHGNASHLEAYTDRLDTYYGWGEFDVFSFDYRGYGVSEGDTEFDGIFGQDGQAAVQYVASETNVALQDIPWIGLSLGAAVAAHTSVDYPAQAMVLENMFPSTEALLDDGSGLDLPAGWFFENDFDNLAAVKQMSAPVLVVHGLDDDFIDPAYALDVYRAAPDPKELWRPAGVGHSDIHQVMPVVYQERVLGFIGEL